MALNKTPIAPHKKSINENRISQEVLTYLMNCGIQAPSGDNAQPWNIKTKDSTILIELDPLADNSFFNYNQIASNMACGAVIENIRISATAFGLETSVQYFPFTDNHNVLAVLAFKYNHVKEDILHKSIWKRHTNRSKYNGTIISKEQCTILKDSLKTIDNASLLLFTDKTKISKIAQLVYQADIIRTERKDIHEHLISMLRFTDEEAFKTKDGLPIKNLEIGLQGEFFLKITRSWNVMKTMNKLGISKVIANESKKGALQASAIGMLKYKKSNSKEQFIESGIGLERVWLTANMLGISFQPMAALPFFKMRWNMGEKNNFSAKHQKRLEKIWPVYDAMFNSNDGAFDVLLFRLGYGKEIEVKTLRKTV